MQLRARSGHAVVEFVLVLPLLLMLALGIADVGRVMTTSGALRRAASSGARKGMSITMADSSIRSFVLASAQPLVPTVDITRGGDSIVVTATASVASVTPLSRLVWTSGSTSVSATATARVTAP